MKCKFVVGQKVVCIHVGPWWDPEKGWFSSSPAPQPGEICRITGMIVEDDGYVGLQLKGYSQEDGFDHKGFKPLRKRKTDISVFKKMLSKVPARKREPAL